MADDLGPDAFDQEALGHRTQCHPGGGFASTRPLQHRAGIVEVILLHSDQVRMSRSRPGQRRIAGDAGEFGRIDWIR